MNGTNTTVNVTLNPRLILSGVSKVKVHSFPPEICVKATLWVCFDLAIEKKNERFGPSVDSVIHHDQLEINISKDIPLIKQQGRQRQDYDGGGGDGDDVILSSRRVPTAPNSKLHKIIKRAAGIAASSTTTPRTCKPV
jgi:hypothetical protein